MTDRVVPAPGAPRIYRVGELVAGLGELIQEAVGRIWVVGEVSNLRRAASGHCYFTLKDEDAQLRGVLFRGNASRLPFEPEDGLEVLAYGEVGVYAARGDLQLIVRQLEPRGQGALQLAFEQLRARLEREGLFDTARKRPLPEFPRRLGVVTSLHGAALRDVIEVSRARCALVPLRLAPARVQGAGADAELAAALAWINTHGDVDVVLLVRGGGSLEDLFPFNSELLARAIVASPKPVVSGVGHETDVTIADLVADLRAPTPSAAAALALPDAAALFGDVERCQRRLDAAVRARLSHAGRQVVGLREQLRHLSPRARLAERRTRLGAVGGRLQQAGERAIERCRGRLERAALRLDSLSPLAVLGRGYAIVRREPDGSIVREPDQVAPGDALSIRVAGGDVAARVLEPSRGKR